MMYLYVYDPNDLLRKMTVNIIIIITNGRTSIVVFELLLIFKRIFMYYASYKKMLVTKDLAFLD